MTTLRPLRFTRALRFARAIDGDERVYDGFTDDTYHHTGLFLNVWVTRETRRQMLADNPVYAELFSKRDPDGLCGVEWPMLVAPFALKPPEITPPVIRVRRADGRVEMIEIGDKQPQQPPVKPVRYRRVDGKVEMIYLDDNGQDIPGAAPLTLSDDAVAAMRLCNSLPASWPEPDDTPEAERGFGTGDDV